MNIYIKNELFVEQPNPDSTETVHDCTLSNIHALHTFHLSQEEVSKLHNVYCMVAKARYKLGKLQIYIMYDLQNEKGQWFQIARQIEDHVRSMLEKMQIKVTGSMRKFYLKII